MNHLQFDRYILYLLYTMSIHMTHDLMKIYYVYEA